MLVSADSYDDLMAQLRLLDDHRLLPETLIEPPEMRISSDEARRRLKQLVEDLEVNNWVARLGNQAVLAPSDLYLHLLNLRQVGLIKLENQS